MEYKNHSGGCPGADMTWEFHGKQYGIKSIAYSFHNHKHEGGNPYIMNTEELLEGWEHIKEASTSLHRPTKNIEYNPYVRNLLCRNWYQVKHSDGVYAVGTFENNDNKKLVSGGTGWAVQMAIDKRKPVYFFDQTTNEWFTYLYEMKKFVCFYSIPTLSENFAGIGTRNLSEVGAKAIKQLYEYNFNTHG